MARLQKRWTFDNLTEMGQCYRDDPSLGSKSWESFLTLKDRYQQKAALQVLWSEAFFTFPTTFTDFWEFFPFFSILPAIRFSGARMPHEWTFPMSSISNTPCSISCIPPVCKTVKSDDTYHHFKVSFLSCLYLTQNDPMDWCLQKRNQSLHLCL